MDSSMSSKDAARAVLDGTMDYDTYADLYASPQSTSSFDDSWHSSSADDDRVVPDVGQVNKPDKQIFVNEMPVGAEDGNHGLFSRIASFFGVYHTNVSVESDAGKITSGMGRDKDKGNGDMPIGMDTKSTDQTARNAAEAQHGNLTKVPLAEYMGGKYKDADPEVLEANLKKQLADGDSTGTYGMPKVTDEGLIRPNICWSHTNDNLFHALPQAEQERRRAANAAYYERLARALGGDENALLDE